MTRGWTWLSLAIFLEVSGTTCMKWSEGFRHLVPSIAVLVLYALSLAALTAAIEHIDLSVAYAVWAGTGTALVGIIGMTLFREAASPGKLLGLALIIAGATLLHATEVSTVPPG